MKFTLQNPIPKRYLCRLNSFLVNQVFGENKNKKYYGEKGHQGIDYKTRFWWGWADSIPGQAYKGWGVIPVLSAHSGQLSTGYNDDPSSGIVMRITSYEFEENGIKTVYQTIYHHLHELRRWKIENGVNYIRRGACIGYSGNTGKDTTGHHLHFELRRKQLIKGRWTNWEAIDPIPYFMDGVNLRKPFSTKLLNKNSMKYTFTDSNVKDTVKVMGFVVLSGIITAMIDFLPNVELGAFAPVVMGTLNVVHVAVKKYLSEE